MTSPLTSDLCREIGNWVCSTRRGRFLPIHSADIHRGLEAVRKATTSEASNGPFDADHETLAALSLLSSELVGVSSPSVNALNEAAGAFDRLSRTVWDDDQFGELSELLCRFAFVAWRHARALGNAPVAQEWLESFETAFLRGSVSEQCIGYFLETPVPHRSAALNAWFLVDPETLFSICTILRERRNARPAALAPQLVSLRDWVTERFWPQHFNDEREYFLAQIEFSLAGCSRWLGDRATAFEWLEKAEDRYTRTVEPETGKAEIDLLRLALRHDEGHFDLVLAGLPSLQSRLEEFRMARPLVKSELLRAATLKNLGRLEESIEPLTWALESQALALDDPVKTFALESLADTFTLLGRSRDAADCLQAAFSLLGRRESPTARAFLKLAAGEMCHVQGKTEEALEAYREALNDYRGLGAESWVAYVELLIADLLLLAGREADAEAEILTALPIIEERKLVREGLAAATILRESMRRRKTDRNALRELREHLRNRTS